MAPVTGKMLNLLFYEKGLNIKYFNILFYK